jgi:hypothetical protein
MEPLTLAALTGAVLTQGITFLYSQAGEILRKRRERRASEEVTPVDSDVVDGELEPIVPDWDAVGELEDDIRELRRQLSDYVEGGIEEPDPADQQLLRRVDALRRSLEVILRQRITFTGEQRPDTGPVVTGEVAIAEVRGYAAAVRAGRITGGQVKGTARVDTVHEGGQVIGVDVDRIGPCSRAE